MNIKLTRQRLEKRIKNIKLNFGGSLILASKEQKHLKACSSERIHWHYGYLIALNDILNKEIIGK